ncbi:MAG: AAA family ATPase, partial [Mailhella sp.]|nr:AAA family ATPase [Mailhella sp.]
MLVTGARQIGKTSLIRKFGREQYKHFIEINFIETPRAADIFKNGRDVNSIVMGITALLGVSPVPGKTLIFLDEIQECPDARTAIKFLVEDGRFDYIESGSLLGVNSKEVSSYPVGFE